MRLNSVTVEQFCLLLALEVLLTSEGLAVLLMSLRVVELVGRQHLRAYLFPLLACEEYNLIRFVY